MKKKRTYLAANIRAGIKVEKALEIVRNSSPVTATRFFVRVDTFNHSRDIYGNGTAHYSVELTCNNGEVCPVFTIVKSGKRREQVGYGGYNQAAIYALERLGYKLDLSVTGSYDYQGVKIYPLIGFEV